MAYKSSRARHHFSLGSMNKSFEQFDSKATIKIETRKDDDLESMDVINKKK